MSYSIKNVVDASSMLQYCADNLGWQIDISAFDDIEDVTYDFTAHDLGLQDSAFAQIKEFRQLRPLVDDQPFGVFLITFENKALSVTALRRILQRLTPSKYGREYKTWKCERIIFFCFWGTSDRRSLGFAAFENAHNGLIPAFKILYCTPAIEDESNRIAFEHKLSLLKWPDNVTDRQAWFDSWRGAFTTTFRQVIQDTKNLVGALASIAIRLRDDFTITMQSECEGGQLHILLKHLQQLLGDRYTVVDFSDMFAQALVYGFFSARCVGGGKAKLDFQSSLSAMQLSNPLIKTIVANACDGSLASVDISLVDELLDVLNATDIDKIVADFNRQTAMGRQVEDPIVYFYEQFLECYDGELRKRLGDYSTPFPAANFMVRASEYVIRELFGCADGFGDSHVSVLDPGTGTATCLRNIILLAHKQFLRTHRQEEWAEYVEGSLLPRLTGFEILMAPYAIARLKLSLALKETGYELNPNTCVGVCLKNSLKPLLRQQASASEASSIAKLIEDEVRFAEQRNSGDIQVIIGGPPFREDSTNKEQWILDLMQQYKKEPGTDTRIVEKNLRPLSNDYVKFVRLAQERIKKSSHAVVAYVIPHTYMDNLTFRGMRLSLLSDFSRIYILDLHGNALGQGHTNDQNIFDIQQGVCVSVFIKAPKPKDSLAEVYYADVVGSRIKKFDFLRKENIDTISWRKIDPQFPSYFMSPRGMSEKASHIEWVNLSELFPVSQVGVKTHHDEQLISMQKFDTPNDQLYEYRPFDVRHINYDRTLVERDRYEVVRHFLGHRNLGLVIDRQVMADNWSHFQVVEHMIDNRLHYSRKGNPYLCPVYLFDDNGKRSLNLNRDLIAKFEQYTGLAFSERETDDAGEFDVFDVVDYAYAILFCNIFRHKFASQLSLNFPSVPLPPSRRAFRALIEQGVQLRSLHAYRAVVPNDLEIELHMGQDAVVRRYKWCDDKAYINPHTYLYPVPKYVWDYCFAGYRGLQKWLKDRNGQELTPSDIKHMINVFNIFARSIEISKFIDTLAIKYFNGFEDESVTVNLSVSTVGSAKDEYVISADQTEWRDAAHRPTGGFSPE